MFESCRRRRDSASVPIESLDLRTAHDEIVFQLQWLNTTIRGTRKIEAFVLQPVTVLGLLPTDNVLQYDVVRYALNGLNVKSIRARQTVQDG